jgi:hypothetical protein
MASVDHPTTMLGGSIRVNTLTGDCARIRWPQANTMMGRRGCRHPGKIAAGVVAGRELDADAAAGFGDVDGDKRPALDRQPLRCFPIRASSPHLRASFLCAASDDTPRLTGRGRLGRAPCAGWASPVYSSVISSTHRAPSPKLLPKLIFTFLIRDRSTPTKSESGTVTCRQSSAPITT